MVILEHIGTGRLGIASSRPTILSILGRFKDSQNHEPTSVISKKASVHVRMAFKGTVFKISHVGSGFISMRILPEARLEKDQQTLRKVSERCICLKGTYPFITPCNSLYIFPLSLI